MPSTDLRNIIFLSVFLFSLVVELPPLTLNQLAKDCDVKVLKPKKELLIAVHIHNEQIAYLDH